MKSQISWLVKLYQPEADSVKWRFLFRFLGVESTSLQTEKELIQVLLHDPPGLIIFDRGLLGEAFTAIESFCDRWLERGGGIALTGHAGLWPIPDYFLNKLTDISERDPFTINDLLQRYIKTYSRKQPRLNTRLPGLYSRVTGNSQICEIMNLSPRGAFIRTTEALPSVGEELLINVPLIGLRKEIEVSGCVVCQTLPNETNNYAQGIGISFQAEPTPAFNELNKYMRYVLTHDEEFDPQGIRFANCRSTQKDSAELKSVSLRPEKGNERVLSPIL